MWVLFTNKDGGLKRRKYIYWYDSHLLAQCSFQLHEIPFRKSVRSYWNQTVNITKKEKKLNLKKIIPKNCWFLVRTNVIRNAEYFKKLFDNSVVLQAEPWNSNSTYPFFFIQFFFQQFVGDFSLTSQRQLDFSGNFKVIQLIIIGQWVGCSCFYLRSQIPPILFRIVGIVPMSSFINHVTVTFIYSRFSGLCLNLHFFLFSRFKISVFLLN